MRLLSFLFVMYMTLFITSCVNEDKKPDVSAVPVTMRVKRFEYDLFNSDKSNPGQAISKLKELYGDFYYLFVNQVTSIGHPDSSVTYDRFVSFIGDTNFRAVYEDCEKKYADFSPYSNQLLEAFKFYKYYLPKGTVPTVITMMSTFSYPIICDSNHLGIALDMYLGSDYRYYNTLQPPLPNYLRSKMRSEYLVCDAMKGWLMSDYAMDDPGAKLLEAIIDQGRILYMLEKVLPDVSDTIKTGYSEKQLKWCYSNEKQIWSFFIDNKLLYSADPNVLSKYVNEGPTTNGFPKESPGNIGQFIGWQIVNSYMKAHPEISPAQLMEEKDLQKIFAESKYKPRK